MSVRKNVTITKLRMSEVYDDEFVAGTPSELIGLMWELTREVSAIGGHYDPERRLQRHVVSIKRRAS